MAVKLLSIIAASMVWLMFASQSALAAPISHSKQATGNSPKKFQPPEDRAIELVEKVKEVQAWEKLFGPKHFNPQTSGRPGFDIEEHHGSVYLVNVFESKPEQNLTFARFEVNVKTGRVKKVD